MSTRTTKRPYARALADARAFRDLLPHDAYLRWEFAGSVRRRKPEVGDVEHVVIPAHAIETGGGLFAEPVAVNLLWREVDRLLADGVVAKHVYGQTATGAPLYRWGDKHRGMDFRGFNHEFFTTSEDAWGAQLLIRTGPADYSERVVTALKRGGMYRQVDGRLIHVVSGEPVPVPTEADYVRLAGLGYVVAEDRR